MLSIPSRPSREDPRVVAEEVAMLYRLAPHALALSALGATLVAALFFSVAQTGPLVAWWAAVNLVLVGRAVHVRAYRRAQPPIEHARRWSAYFSCGAFCAGLAWGVLGTPLLPVESYSYEVIFAVVNVA